MLIRLSPYADLTVFVGNLYKLGAMLTAEYNRKHGYIESADKMNDLVLEIIKKEDITKFPNMKADEEIEKLYFAIQDEKEKSLKVPLNMLVAGTQITRDLFTEYEDENAEKNTENLAGIKDSFFSFFPISNVEKFNNVIKMIQVFVEGYEKIPQIKNEHDYIWHSFMVSSFGKP